MSKGEEKISSLLKSARISYLKEYTFSDLKYKNALLRFDFAIISYGRPINLLNMMENNILSISQNLAHIQILNICKRMIEEKMLIV